MNRFAAGVGSAALCVLATVSMGAVKTGQVEYEIGGQKHIGYLAYEESTTGPAKRPGVLVVPEWWGANDYAKRRARQLADLGYIAMVADMYGDAKVATDPKEAGSLAGGLKKDRPELRKRAKAALAILKEQPQVDSKRVAAIGYCFGGTVVLELARSGVDLNGAVSIHGGLEFPDPVTTGTVKAKTLVLHGADDPTVPPAQVNQFLSDMKNAGATVEFIAYPGAVHAFSNPASDERKSASVAYNKEADEKSWEAMKAFLADVLGKN